MCQWLLEIFAAGTGTEWQQASRVRRGRRRRGESENNDLPSDLASSCRYFWFGFAFAKMSINTDGQREQTDEGTDRRTADYGIDIYFAFYFSNILVHIYLFFILFAVRVCVCVLVCVAGKVSYFYLACWICFYFVLSDAADKILCELVSHFEIVS